MKKQIYNILVFILILWIIKITDSIIPYDFCNLGIVPRKFSGLIGVVLSPFLHANYFHLISNTIPIFVLLIVLFTFYSKNAWMVIIESVVIGGVLVWLFGRTASHVGISGLIYSLASFLIVAGIYKKDLKSILVSIGVVAVYGSLIWGIFPGRYWVSWEGHLFGAVAGALIAYFHYKNTKNLDTRNSSDL